MTEVAVDNDILIKCSCYALLDEVIKLFGGRDSVGILGAAPFVVRQSLEADVRINDPATALFHWEACRPLMAILEPTDQEVGLAIAIEESAAVLGVPLDSGESQLAAIALLRPVPRIATGDKRAIGALEQLQALVEALSELGERLICLEQLVMALVPALAHEELAHLVCREPAVDTALAICCRCATDVAIDMAGLESYVGAIRSEAPTLLATFPP